MKSNGLITVVFTQLATVIQRNTYSDSLFSQPYPMGKQSCYSIVKDT